MRCLVMAGLYHEDQHNFVRGHPPALGDAVVSAREEG
jgi:hypothetical protein